MPNTLAKYVLTEYLATSAPRYALLINAPWGVGKTEFIKTQTQYETDKDFLYLSLYGIDSVEAFNEALLGAIMRAPGSEIKKNSRHWGEKFKNVLSNSQAFGFSVNLSSFSLVEGLKKYLPSTLIFDDLERIVLPHSTMSGILNQFIEHEKRRVILIANTDKIRQDEKETFDTTREKAIGQTIQIEPDVGAALQSYWENIPTGRGKVYLQKRHDLITTIFNQGKHGNLRLLRYAMQAAANLLNKIDEELFQYTQPIEKLVRTFLALHMAYVGGRIGKAELMKRHDSSAFGADIFGIKKPGEQVLALMKLVDSHPDCDIRIPYNGSPLPLDLATTLLVKGFAEEGTINDQLRQTHFFTPPKDIPDWAKLWHWGELSVSDLTGVLDRLTARLSENDITNPGEFIQIYGAMHWIAKLGGLEQSQDELSAVFLGYIQNMTTAGKIKPRSPTGSAHERYVFGNENNSVNYGGHVFETDEISKKVVEALKAEMNNKFDIGLVDVASNLLEHLENSPEDFLEQIRYNHNSSNYASTPILQHIEKSRFADRLMDLIENDREMATQIFVLIMARREGRQGNLNEEHVWIDDLKKEILSRAAAKSRLFGAQVNLLFRRRL